MDFDYESLAFLTAVVRTGSFEAAAKSLNVTQSAVSQRIKQLEEKVGTVLVVRGRPCVASDDGLLLCQHFEQVSLLSHEVRERLRVGGNVSKGKARIAVNADSLETWFPEVIARAASELNLLLEIIPDDQEFTDDRLRSGDAIAIVSSSEAVIPGCKVYPLGKMEYLAIASANFVKENFADGVTLDSTSQSISIRFDLKDNLPIQWLELAFGKKARLTSHFVPSYGGHLQCCQLGIGWALMPKEAVVEHLASGELIEIVPDARIMTPLYWHTHGNANETLQQLSKIVSEIAQSALDQADPIQVKPVVQL
jgi:LysR family transcriptional regulator (chromosome initiation inhibitor)